MLERFSVHRYLCLSNNQIIVMLENRNLISPCKGCNSEYNSVAGRSLHHTSLLWLQGSVCFLLFNLLKKHAHLYSALQIPPSTLNSSAGQKSLAGYCFLTASTYGCQNTRTVTTADWLQSFAWPTVFHLAPSNVKLMFVKPGGTGRATPLIG